MRFNSWKTHFMTKRESAALVTQEIVRQTSIPTCSKPQLLHINQVICKCWSQLSFK